MPLWLRGLTGRVGLRLIQVASSLLVVVSLPVLLNLGRRGAKVVSTPDVSQSTASSSSSSSVFQVGMLSNVLHQSRIITSNRFVLNMVHGHHAQLRSCPLLFCNIQQFNVQLIIPLLRRRWISCFLRDHLNHLLVVLVSIPVCLLFLSILVASGPHLTLSSLIVTSIYLLLTCLPSDMSGSLFSMVIMLSPLISRMLIYIFLLLSIIIIFIICLAQYTISVEGFTFWAGYSP